MISVLKQDDIVLSKKKKRGRIIFYSKLSLKTIFYIFCIKLKDGVLRYKIRTSDVKRIESRMTMLLLENEKKTNRQTTEH